MVQRASPGVRRNPSRSAYSRTRASVACETASFSSPLEPSSKKLDIEPSARSLPIRIGWTARTTTRKQPLLTLLLDSVAVGRSVAAGQPAPQAELLRFGPTPWCPTAAEGRRRRLGRCYCPST